MPKRTAPKNLARPQELRTSLVASGVVGTWEWDLLNRCVYYDEEAAALHTGDRSLAGHPVRGHAAIANVHPADREWMMRDMILETLSGGLFLTEYRVVCPDLGIRWLLCRGRIYRGEDGRALRCRGIMIDITESREASDAGEGYVARPAVHEENAIIQAADRCLEAREAILQHGSPLLRQKVDALLLAIGRELALLQDDERPSNLH